VVVKTWKKKKNEERALSRTQTGFLGSVGGLGGGAPFNRRRAVAETRGGKEESFRRLAKFWGKGRRSHS